MLTREQAQQLTERVLKFSTLPDCSVGVNERELAYLRFANNGLTTSGLSLERTVTITSVQDAKVGSSSTTDLSDEALKAAVLRSEQIAAIAPPNPEYMEPLPPQKYPEHDNWDEATAQARAPQMTPHVKTIIDAAVAKKLIAAGYIERIASVRAFGTKRGNRGYSRLTDTALTTTVRNAAGTSSGWAGHPTVRIGEIDSAGVAARAIEKCSRWIRPARLDPGKYTVILEPAAVASLVGYLGYNLSARSAEQGQSFLSKKGGGTLVGDQLFPEIVTIRTDPFDRRLPGDKWTSDMAPLQPITWIDKGTVKNVEFRRYWASKTGKDVTPDPESLIMDGSDRSIDDLIKATERGLLVTRLWYIRPVNPQTLQLTGLTRDGLFLVENGKITQPVMNMRFNESVVRMLQNTTMVSKSLRIYGGEAGMIAPAIQARDFTFTSISDAV